MVHQRSSSSRAAISNPFGPDDDDDNNPFAASSEQKTSGRATNSHVRSKTIGSAAPSVNPFGDDDSSPTNPFEAKRKSFVTNPVVKKNDGGNSNPFGETDRKSKPSQPQSQPRQTKSQHTRSKTMQNPVDPFEFDPSGKNKATSPKGNASQNSYDFDPDFCAGADKSKSANKPFKNSSLRGDKRKPLNGSSGGAALEPMVAGMDWDGVKSKPEVGGVGTDTILSKSTPSHKRSQSEFISKSSRKNNRHSEVQGGGETLLASWLRGNKNADDDEFSAAGKEKKKLTVGEKEKNKEVQINHQQKQKEKSQGKKKRCVQRWLYDDYHKEQEKFYKSLEESESATAKAGDTQRRRRSNFGGYNSGSEDEKKNDKKSNDFNASGKFFERPPELPGIKETVQNLSFFEFEKKAEERAISIVSTWLFDAGLIDELLVNGANGNHQSSTSSITASSVMSNEGVEVGAHGFPIEGGLKIDKEVEKLRASAQRELTLINTRLNDGVAASGLEVQELVNAVSATQNNLGRLRELTTYVSSGYRENGEMSPSDMKNGMLLAEFPRLKRSINARRNIFRCFRELEFFSQIPTTCDRLREELHEGEWTDNEWKTIRNVCMEHVELEILLVEAEAGMKAWFDDTSEGGDDDDASAPSILSHNTLLKSWKNSNSSISSHYGVVDNFLSQYVKNVWELGGEILERILSGVGSAFEIALRDPAAMVALVESVEVYERAADQYKKVHANEDQSTTGNRNRLHFTDMRAKALEKLYRDFECRGLEIFRTIHMQAADVADDKDALNTSFTAVLRAATELVTEIDVVKLQMAPCFAPRWHVEMLWSSCVAHVCSNQILQQIGGPDGQNLPELTVTQLLDLLAWVEYFRETIEEAFPSVASKDAKKTYFDERPDLFADNSKEVNMENATDNLVWVNNMLWEIHRLAQDEFVIRTRAQTDEWLNNVYDAVRETRQTNEGRLMTSLCEDVFSVAAVQLRTIRTRLTRKSEALVLAVSLIFSRLRDKQMHARDKFLQDLDNCCAAANDFIRMAEQCEDVLQELLDHCDLPEQSSSLLEESCAELVSLYSADAVFASQKTHEYIFKPIRGAITDDLFSLKWENDTSHNEQALILIRTLEDFMGDLETFLDEFMLKKAVNALVTSSVIFYMKCLLERAERHNNNRVIAFQDIGVAFERMFRDIKIIRDYFEGLAEGMPALTKHIEKEFEVLTTVQELMRIAATESEDNARDFIVVLHKVIKDINITKHVVGDLWHLVAPTKERAVWELTESLEANLIAVCPPELTQTNNRLNVSGLHLDETLAHFYMQTKRKRPVVAGNAEKVFTAMKSKWNTEG